MAGLVSEPVGPGSQAFLFGPNSATADSGAIHALGDCKDVDARDKRGHDEFGTT
jgi:hypothetical protein